MAQAESRGCGPELRAFGAGGSEGGWEKVAVDEVYEAQG